MSAENCIIDVHSITAAPLGWKFVDDNQPVACFALITVASVAHPGQFQGRMVIGLGTNDLCLDLLGKDVSMLTGDMHFVAQEIWGVPSIGWRSKGWIGSLLGTLRLCQETNKHATPKPHFLYQTGVIKPQRVTDFQGKRTAGEMSDSQVANARQIAMAGVIGKNDPVTGARMMREVKSAERDDQRFGWEQQRAERDGWKFADEEKRDKFMKGLESEVGQFMQSRLVGPDGQTRPATTDDYLAASEFKAAKLIESGKMEDAAQTMKEHNSQAFIKIQLETAERDKALGETIAAVNAGNLDAARSFYDRFLPDGAQVTNVRQERTGQIVVERKSATGKQIPPMTFTDVNQMTASLAALKDPMAVYNWSQNEFKNNLASRQDARAERADGRAVANASTGRQDEAARVSAATALFQERNPSATPTEIEAVRRGVLPAVPRNDQKFVTQGSDITSLLGDPATDSRGQPLMDPMTGRQVVNRNQQRERELCEFMEKNGIRDTNEGIQRFITAKQQKGQEGGGKAIAKGQVVDGYEFLGGDPKVQKNWCQVARGRVQWPAKKTPNHPRR